MGYLNLDGLAQFLHRADSRFATAAQGKTADALVSGSKMASIANTARGAAGSTFKLGAINTQAEFFATTDLNVLLKFHPNNIFALYYGEYGKSGPWTLCPNGDSSMRLGCANSRWNELYVASGTIQTSDLRKKKDVAPLAKASEFLMRLRPISYKMIDGESGRTHWGLGAQDVEQAMCGCGLTDKDFAGFIRSPKMEDVDTGTIDADGKMVTEKRIVSGEYEYGLRYEEFIAPLIATVQAQQRTIEDLTARVAALETKG